MIKYYERWVSFKFILKFCSWVFKQTLTQRGRVRACGRALLGEGAVLPQVRLTAGFACLLPLCVSNAALIC